jgi:adenylate kinase
MAERLKVYGEKTAPLVEHYRARGILSDVDGSGEISRISDRIDRAVTRAVRPRGEVQAP